MPEALVRVSAASTTGLAAGNKADRLMAVATEGGLADAKAKTVESVEEVGVVRSVTTKRCRGWGL